MKYQKQTQWEIQYNKREYMKKNDKEETVDW